MQIIIDIDDEDYKRIQDIPDVFNSLTSRTYLAIRNGTPLPKGHGRLVDADALIEELSVVSSRPVKSQLYLIGEAQTIIEADKAEREQV